MIQRADEESLTIGGFHEVTGIYSWVVKNGPARAGWLRTSVALLGLCALALQTPAVSATLDRPLPPHSLEQNGEPQMLEPHQLRLAPPPALPGGGPHPHAQQGLKRDYSGSPVDVLTYHYDSLRTGWNSNETDLTPANVGSPSFGQIATIPVDGGVLAQPLMVSNFAMPDGSTHNVLVIATSNNSVYAFDAQTYAQLWHVNLGQNQSPHDVGCTDLSTGYGISSTPVITRNPDGSATIYLVSATEPAPYSFHTQIHALDVGTGADVLPPTEIAPSATLTTGATMAFVPQDQWNRASLAYANGSIYVGIGSHCDEDSKSSTGWLLRYDTSLNPAHAFNTITTPTPGLELASIWMSGFAPAIDSQGDVFVVTGNGSVSFSRRTPNYGQSVLALKPDLSQVLSRFTPASYKTLNQHDIDFGSGGVMLLPTVDGQTAPTMAVTMGKDATLYLLNTAALGGYQTGDAGALQSQRIGPSGTGLWGGPAYYGAAGGGVVYAQIGNDVLRSFAVNTTAPAALTPLAVGASPAGYGGSIPIVSSNGAAPGTGVVWLIRRAATAQLEAYDALALGSPIFAANAGTSNGHTLTSPMVANGRVYVPGRGVVTVFGLTDD